jgi:hypothetical protein
MSAVEPRDLGGLIRESVPEAAAANHRDPNGVAVPSPR